MRKDFWGFSSDWFVWWEVDKGNKNCQFIWEYKIHNKPHKECKGDATIKIFSNGGQGHVCRREDNKEIGL